VQELNIPSVLRELTAAFEAYERALLANDFDALSNLFWESDLTLRYGTKDSQQSHAEIAEFRRKRGPVDQRRALRNTRIVTFGHDFGVANTEFVSAAGGKLGRQSQTWVRTDKGWKIVSAHVSYVEGG
jgi:hypothetical protein